MSEKVYIGQTCDMSKRFKRHLSDKRISKKASWIKSLKINYNDIPKIEIIEDDIEIRESSDRHEKFWIASYRYFLGKDKVLNMTDGGDGQSKGYVPSKESRKKVSNSLMGRKFSEETLKILRELSAAKKGIKRTDEVKSKISKSLKGRYVGDKNPNYGKHPTEEFIEKMRKLKTGSRPTNRKISDEDIINIRKLKLQGKACKNLAKQYNVCKNTIQNIIYKKYYKTVGAENEIIV